MAQLKYDEQDDYPNALQDEYWNALAESEGWDYFADKEKYP